MNAAATLPPERDLAVFIDFVVRYFKTVGGSEPAFLDPTLETGLPGQLDWTGYMPVTGRLTGWIGLSLPSVLINSLLGRMGEDRRDDEARQDLIAEITGTITSNAREHFGERFLVHPPLAAAGDAFPAELIAPPLSFRLPFAWQGEEGYLLVALHP